MIACSVSFTPAPRADETAHPAVCRLERGYRPQSLAVYDEGGRRSVAHWRGFGNRFQSRGSPFPREARAVATRRM